MTPSKVLQAMLGTLIALGFMAITYLVLTRVIPTENKDIALILLGQLSGAFVSVVGFAFGSSVGSQRKDESVYITRKAPPAAPVPTPQP